MWAVWTYVAAFFVERHQLGSQEVGWMYLVTGVAALLGTLLAGGRPGRRPRRLLIGARTGSALLVAPALILPVPVLIAVALLAAALMLHTASGLATVNLLSEEAPTGRATSLTLNSSALSLGAALGSALGGLALEIGGYSMLGVLAAGLGLSAAGLVGCLSTRPLASWVTTLLLTSLLPHAPSATTIPSGPGTGTPCKASAR
jgi:predicted MFS family arabinose efflux permease